jgi:thiol-disulfide isomerase/thioredoxin
MMKSVPLFSLLAAFSTACFAQFAPPADQNTAGIGIALGVADGALYVSKVMPDSPAAASKQIHEGDRLLAVGQGEDPAVSLVGKTMEECVLLVRGAAGSRVRLTVSPEGAAASQARDVLLTRDDILNPLGLALDATLLKVGTPAPELRYARLSDGKATTLSDAHRGHVVVVQFWATWSAPAQQAVTAMQKIAATHTNQKDKVAFVAVSIDGDSTTASTTTGVLDKVSAHVKKMQWPHTENGWASVEGRSDWYIGSVPLIYVISADGTILAADLSLSKVDEFLSSVMRK